MWHKAAACLQVPAPGSVARHAWPLPAWVAWWLLHRATLTLTLTSTVALGWPAGPVVLGVALVLVVVALIVWRCLHPASFEPTAGRVLLGIWRSGWAYGVRWRTAMMLSGLAGRFDGGARSCRATARPGRPGYVELAVGRRDPLAQVVPALPIAETVDLDAAPWCPDLGRQRASGVPVATAIVTRPARVAQTAEQRTRNSAAGRWDVR